MKLITPVLISVCVISLVGCNQQKQNNSIPYFSYADESKIYADGTPGVKTDGFANISETEINSVADAVKIAQNECTVKWDKTQVSFDSTASIWRVDFYTDLTVGGNQTVYLDGNGKTVLIVYGE